ncbi:MULTISPECIES: hypothetical protein [unclassified Rathayibacter]|uniref:hypothetical protein n=1 Tax=unclassified Rathayibacter TaxID=2609250 RepID=UPI0006FB6489|nr:MULTISPECIES: hypothetical protein [unclassified Rathayibacter]KQQ05081.1 hypothetical protein ASF42_00165 [Rathayibacter sp. Leaf294]KQS12944.1 hypothetical protein ASG06_00165 [Rathayibacter sp. Leaf185]
MTEPTPAAAADASAPARRLTPRRLALISGAVLTLVGLALVALIPLQYWSLAQQGFDAVCSASVGGVPPGEGTLVGGSWSWWPLGASCEWQSLDGATRVDQPDWSSTAVAITGAAILLVGVVTLLVAAFRRRR